MGEIGNSVGLMSIKERRKKPKRERGRSRTDQWVWSEPVCQHHSLPVSVILIVFLAQLCWPFNTQATVVMRNVASESEEEKVSMGRWLKGQYQQMDNLILIYPP